MRKNNVSSTLVGRRKRSHLQPVTADKRLAADAAAATTSANRYQWLLPTYLTDKHPTSLTGYVFSCKYHQVFLFPVGKSLFSRSCC